MDNDSPSNKKVISLQKGGVPVSPLSAAGRNLTPADQKKLIAFMDSIHDFGHTGNRYALGVLNFLFPTMTNPPITAEAMAADYATGSIDSASQLKNLCMGDPIAMGRAVSFERRTTAMFDNCALEKAFTKAITWEEIIKAPNARNFAAAMGAPGSGGISDENNILVIQNGPNPALSYVRALKERKGNITFAGGTQRSRIWARNKVAGFVLNYMFPDYADETVGVTYDAAGAKITTIFSDITQVKAVITPTNIADSASTMLDPYQKFKQYGQSRTQFIFPQKDAKNTTLKPWVYNENATLFLGQKRIQMVNKNFNVNNPNGFEIIISTGGPMEQPNTLTRGLKVNYDEWTKNVPSGPSAPYLANLVNTQAAEDAKVATARAKMPTTPTIIPFGEYEIVAPAGVVLDWKQVQKALIDMKRTGDYEQVNAALAVQEMFPAMNLILGTGDTLCSTYARMRGQACILGGLGGSGQEEGEEVLVLFRRPRGTLDPKVAAQMDNVAAIRQGELDRTWINNNASIAIRFRRVGELLWAYKEKFSAKGFVKELNASYYQKIQEPAKLIKTLMIDTWTNMLRLKIMNRLTVAAEGMRSGGAEARAAELAAAVTSTTAVGWKQLRATLETFQEQLATSTQAAVAAAAAATAAGGGDADAAAAAAVVAAATAAIIRAFAEKIARMEAAAVPGASVTREVQEEYELWKKYNPTAAVDDAVSLVAAPVESWNGNRGEKQFLSKIGFNFGFLRGCAKDIDIFINRFPGVTPSNVGSARTVASAKRRAESDIMNLSKGKWRTNLEDILAVPEDNKCQINKFIDAIVNVASPTPPANGTLNDIKTDLVDGASYLAVGAGAGGTAAGRTKLAKKLLKDPLVELWGKCGDRYPVDWDFPWPAAVVGGGSGTQHGTSGSVPQQSGGGPLEEAEAIGNFYTNIMGTVELISSQCNNILIERFNTYWSAPERQPQQGLIHLGAYSIFFNLFKTLDRWLNGTTTIVEDGIVVPVVTSTDDFFEMMMSITQQAQWWIRNVAVAMYPMADSADGAAGRRLFASAMYGACAHASKGMACGAKQGTWEEFFGAQQGGWAAWTRPAADLFNPTKPNGIDKLFDLNNDGTAFMILQIAATPTHTWWSTAARGSPRVDRVWGFVRTLMEPGQEMMRVANTTWFSNVAAAWNKAVGGVGHVFQRAVGEGTRGDNSFNPRPTWTNLLKIIKYSCTTLGEKILTHDCMLQMIIHLQPETATELAIIWSQQMWNHIDTLVKNLYPDDDGEKRAQLVAADELGLPILNPKAVVTTEAVKVNIKATFTTINAVTKNIENALFHNPLGFSRLYNQLQFNPMSFDIISTPSLAFFQTNLWSKTNPFPVPTAEKYREIGAQLDALKEPVNVGVNAATAATAAGQSAAAAATAATAVIYASAGPDAAEGGKMWKDDGPFSKIYIIELPRDLQAAGMLRYTLAPRLKWCPPNKSGDGCIVSLFNNDPAPRGDHQKPIVLDEQVWPLAAAADAASALPHPAAAAATAESFAAPTQQSYAPPDQHFMTWLRNHLLIPTTETNADMLFWYQTRGEAEKAHYQGLYYEYIKSQHHQQQQSSYAGKTDYNGGGHKRLHTRKQKRRRRKTKRRVRRKQSRKRKQRKRKRTRRKQRKQRKKRRRRHKRRYKRGTTRKRFR